MPACAKSNGHSSLCHKSRAGTDSVLGQDSPTCLCSLPTPPVCLCSGLYIPAGVHCNPGTPEEDDRGLLEAGVGAKRLQHHHADSVHGERAGRSAPWGFHVPAPAKTRPGCVSQAQGWVCALHQPLFRCGSRASMDHRASLIGSLQGREADVCSSALAWGRKGAEVELRWSHAHHPQVFLQYLK